MKMGIFISGIGYLERSMAKDGTNIQKGLNTKVNMKMAKEAVKEYINTQMGPHMMESLKMAK